MLESGLFDQILFCISI